MAAHVQAIVKAGWADGGTDKRAREVHAVAR